MRTARGASTELLQSGAGYDKFQEIAAAQGSTAAAITRYADSWRPAHRHEIRAARSGVVSEVQAREVGFALVDLGAGRRTAADPVDHSAGVIFEKQPGETVTAGELLATVYWSGSVQAAAGLRRLERAFVIADTAPPDEPLLKFYCDATGVKPVGARALTV